MNYTIKFYKHFDVLLIFGICILIFSYLISFVATDIQAHVEFVKKINDDTVAYPPNFLFYYLINLFSGFSSKSNFLYPVSVGLLSLSCTAKYYISKKIIIQLTRLAFEQSKSLVFILISIGLFFCFAIPDPASLFFLKKMYLGKIVPTVWHNSTTILVFPFAILLFWKQLEVFKTNTVLKTKTVLFLNLLVVINILIKPSFIFCYLPVTFVFILLNFKKKRLRWLFIRCLPLMTAALLILLQYYLIYALNIGSFKQEKSGVMLSWPFEVYTFWIPWWLIPISFLLSLALPIATLVCYREVLKYKPFLYATALMITGLFISAFILESGPRMSHGNFTWQNIVCCFLLFLATVAFLTPKFLRISPWSKKTKFLFILFVLHSISGVLYLLKILITNQYI
ncbi:hypothetical protein ACFQO1_04170 [Jejudonia soesokkakensis]|uniref:Beta-carotene 15,15'-monooxygenase n=1 Tax=Jejudonia soesokkakensis TaxID=1323432 RepID=A0ABW2MSJ8_9FLAO